MFTETETLEAMQSAESQSNLFINNAERYEEESEENLKIKAMITCVIQELDKISYERARTKRSSSRQKAVAGQMRELIKFVERWN